MSASPAWIAANLVPPEIAGAYRLLTAMLVALRLVAPDSAEPPDASRALVARACGLGSWQELLAVHERARHSIQALWAEVSAGEGG